MVVTRRLVSSIIALLVLVSLLPQAVTTAATAQSSPGAVLSLATAVVLPTPSTVISVAGRGFSPGGLVYLAIYDLWGSEVLTPVWTVAGTAGYGPNGSADPARGYHATGSISETIALLPATIYGPNGSQDPAQGYVRGTEQITTAFYGPNGSQDPARGYLRIGGETSLGRGCGRDLMVRAYDQRAAGWSNLLDVRAAC